MYLVRTRVASTKIPNMIQLSFCESLQSWRPWRAFARAPILDIPNVSPNLVPNVPQPGPPPRQPP